MTVLTVAMMLFSVFSGINVSGRITGVAVDPSDPCGNTVYTTGTNGGVWR